MARRLAVALDGHSAAGKGTLARALAQRFGLAHLDTGLLYRAVASLTLAAEQGQAGVDPVRIAQQLTLADLSRSDLRSEAVAARASELAALTGVRAALLAFQRDFAPDSSRGQRGVLLDGRDIGTVILPDATVKLFLTASQETRARRRYEELLGRGEAVTLAAVLADMQARDARDSSRAAAPTRAADDAVVIDSSSLTAAEVLAQAEAVLRAAGVEPQAALGATLPSPDQR